MADVPKLGSGAERHPTSVLRQRDTPMQAAWWSGCCDPLREEVVEPSWCPTDTPVTAHTIWEMNWSFSAQFPGSGGSGFTARGQILPACSAASGPALFAARSLAKGICSGTYPALIMKA